MIDKKDYFKIFLIIILILQPLIELDYLAYDFLHQFNIPRLTTILRYLIFPSCIIYGFYKYDSNKKRSLLLGLGYVGILLIYFIMHSNYAESIVSQMILSNNFYFSMFQEFVYLLTLMLPYFLIYLFYNIGFTVKDFKYVVIGLSIAISVPILISNIFVFGYSTYLPKLKDNIFSWYTDGYINFKPRELPGKFYFQFGNPIGVLLFMILPLLYYYNLKEDNLKYKVMITITIIIQSISMFILSTRVSVYGAILAPIIFIIINLFTRFISKNNNSKVLSNLFPLIMIIILSLNISYTPMIQSQLDYAKEDNKLLEDNKIIEENRDSVNKMLDNSINIDDPILIDTFKKYGIDNKLITATPKYYYLDYYPYTFDAYFWNDLLFNTPLKDRVDGRQFQKIFLFNKINKLKDNNYKYLGVGYSTFMNGGLILENDFIQQYYSFGLIGFILLLCPWFIMLMYGLFKVLINFKNNSSMELLILAVSLLFGLVGALASGNVIDHYITTTFMAILTSLLLRLVNRKA